MWKAMNVDSSNVRIDKEKWILIVDEPEWERKFRLSKGLTKDVEEQINIWKIRFDFIMHGFNLPIITNVYEN